MASPGFFTGGVELHEVHPQVLGGWVVEVLKVESPLHVSEVMRRVANSAGITRVGSRIQHAFLGAFRSAIRDEMIRQSGDFLWLRDMTLAPLRDRSNLPPAYRKLEWVAPEEIQLAIERAVEESYGMVEEQIPQAACGLLGFGRVTEDMSTTVDKQIQAMLKEGRLQQRGTQVFVPEEIPIRKS